MEFLKNVLIKEVDGGKNGDKVVYIDNLPKDFLFRRVKKLVIDRNDKQQQLVPAYRVEGGVRVETGEMSDELLPGIERSQTGDNAYCFFTQYNEAKERLAAIDHYVKAKVPVMERVPQREYYAMQPGVMTSGTRPLSDLPRIVLPEPVSPPSKDVQASASSAAVSDVTAPQTAPARTRKPWTEAQKEEARKRMARAREIRTAQQTGKLKA